jgi:hypothetical protein
MHSVANSSDKADAVYLALLARKPTAQERAKLPAANGGDSKTIESLIYALLNTKQFMFIQ